MAKENEVQLGDKVKDPFTGVTGTVMAVTRYMFGCRHVGVLVKKDKKEYENPNDLMWFEELRIDVTEPAHPQPETERTGGPMLGGAPR